MSTKTDARKLLREERLNRFIATSKVLSRLLEDKNVAKLSLVLLYLAEGSKNRHGSLVFGNSDPGIISLFMHLIRECYSVDETRFRCTVQCRSGQNTNELGKFWSGITKIPPDQFYKARVDPRTLGKPLLHPEYRGVCRVDYFSANVYNELSVIGKTITGLW